MSIWYCSETEHSLVCTLTYMYIVHIRKSGYVRSAWFAVNPSLNAVHWALKLNIECGLGKADFPLSGPTSLPLPPLPPPPPPPPPISPHPLTYPRSRLRCWHPVHHTLPPPPTTRNLLTPQSDKTLSCPRPQLRNDKDEDDKALEDIHVIRWICFHVFCCVSNIHNTYTVHILWFIFLGRWLTMINWSNDRAGIIKCIIDHGHRGFETDGPTKKERGALLTEKNRAWKNYGQYKIYLNSKYQTLKV